MCSCRLCQNRSKVYADCAYLCSIHSELFFRDYDCQLLPESLVIDVPSNSAVAYPKLRKDSSQTSTRIVSG